MMPRGLAFLLLGSLVFGIGCSERAPAAEGRDAGSTAADAGAADSGAPAADAETPAADSGAPAPDAETPAPDSGPAPDAGAPAADAGTPSADAGTPADDAGTPSADAGTSASGCGRAQNAGLIPYDIMVNGRSRHYQLYVPPGYDPSTPLRLVFTFHGLGGDGNQIRAYLSLENDSAGEALIVYPDGRVLPGQGTTGWEEADLDFFDAMRAEISANYCVDPSRIFATGHSFGAYMTDTLGCRRGQVLRAVASVSGGTLGGACQRPLPAWLAHGDNDPTVPQSEGIAARDHWISTNGCSSSSQATTPAGCVSYSGCPSDAPVVWCSFAGGHYPLPSYTRSAIWAFFRANS